MRRPCRAAHDLVVRRTWQCARFKYPACVKERDAVEVLWGILMAIAGTFLIVCAIMRSEFVVYRLLVARSRLLWSDHVHQFHQVVGGLLLVLGVLWASGGDLAWIGDTSRLSSCCSGRSVATSVTGISALSHFSTLAFASDFTVSISIDRGPSSVCTRMSTVPPVSSGAST